MIDKKMVAKMKREGLSDKIIAKRLSCNERTIRRIKKNEGIENSTIIDRDTELFKRELLLDLGETGRSVGELYGVSRQAILKLS